jgi:hypothetical protein
MKHEEAAKIVAVLFASYPQSKFDRDNAKAYVDGIADLEASATGTAVQRLIRTNKFLPSIAEIREAATAQRHGPVRTGEEAYAELLAAVLRHGPDYGPIDTHRRRRDPLFADPIIARCIGVWGSWNDLCDSQRDDPGGRARFIELFNELTGRERQAVVSGVPLPPPERPRIGFAPPARPTPAMAQADAPTGQPPALPIVATQSPKQPPVVHQARKWTPEELDAELAKTAKGGGR